MQNIGYETVIFQVFIMEEIRKVKYKVGQKFMVEMREGYHLSKIVRREIEKSIRHLLRPNEHKKRVSV